MHHNGRSNRAVWLFGGLAVLLAAVLIGYLLGPSLRTRDSRK